MRPRVVHVVTPCHLLIRHHCIHPYACGSAAHPVLACPQPWPSFIGTACSRGLLVRLRSEEEERQLGAIASRVGVDGVLPPGDCLQMPAAGRGGMREQLGQACPKPTHRARCAAASSPSAACSARCAAQHAAGGCAPGAEPRAHVPLTCARLPPLPPLAPLQ